MAENEFSVSGTVTDEADDTITETSLAQSDAKPNETDYFVRGCGISVDDAANTVTIGNTDTRGNYAVVQEDKLAYKLFPDQAADESLPNGSGVNHVWIFYDTANDQIKYHIDDDDTAPTEPSLKRCTIDTSTDPATVTLLNPDPLVAVRQLDVADTGSDPTANGEVTRNGADVKAHSGGAARNLSNVNANPYEIARIDDTDSPYTTQGEKLILADTSSAAVTVRLSTTDVGNEEAPVVVNVDGANDVTVDTEGSETIDPGGDSSKTIPNAGEARQYSADGTNWDESSVVEFEAISNTDYNETVNALGNVSGTGASSVSIDLTQGNYVTATLTGDTEFTFDNPSGTPAGNSFYLVVTQDGTGGRSITWPSSVEWPNGTTPSLDDAANAVNALTFTSPDGGTTWRGTVRGEGFA